MNSLDKYSETEWLKYQQSNTAQSINDLIVKDEEIVCNGSCNCECIDCKCNECIEGDCKCMELEREFISHAQERKNIPVFSGVLKYFPNAIKEVARCSKVGNDQHHPDKPLHWDMDKSKDEYDALTRHLIDHTIEPVDKDGILHLTKVAWRALAGLERHLTNNH